MRWTNAEPAPISEYAELSLAVLPALGLARDLPELFAFGGAGGGAFGGESVAISEQFKIQQEEHTNPTNDTFVSHKRPSILEALFFIGPQELACVKDTSWNVCGISGYRLGGRLRIHLVAKEGVVPPASAVGPVLEDVSELSESDELEEPDASSTPEGTSTSALKSVPMVRDFLKPFSSSPPARMRNHLIPSASVFCFAAWSAFRAFAMATFDAPGFEAQW